jgi:hypothetical protein
MAGLRPQGTPTTAAGFRKVANQPDPWQHRYHDERFYPGNIDGNEIVVEKTRVIRRCHDGKLRLCADKSALPYDPAKMNRASGS